MAFYLIDIVEDVMEDRPSGEIDIAVRAALRPLGVSHCKVVGVREVRPGMVMASVRRRDQRDHE